ncbi:MAG: hypothetical protein WCT07_00160 [Candidatus Paceibacterota bacterium]|jgi:hypothetical protein
MKKRTRALFKKIFIRTSITFLIGATFFVYFKTGFLTIHTYELVGVEEKYQPILKDKFMEYDKQKLYKILPSNRVISYHSKDMKSFIRELLPNTSHVSIYPTSLHTLRISVTSYAPLFKLNNSQAITKEGFIYKELSDISALPTLSYATSSNITPEILSQIEEIIPKISATIFSVQSVFINEYGDIYITNEGGESSVILSKDSDVKKIWSNLVSAIDTEPLKSKLQKEKGELKYLDTRFGNKVFFRFTNTDKTNIISSHDATTTASTTISR